MCFSDENFYLFSIFELYEVPRGLSLRELERAFPISVQMFVSFSVSGDVQSLTLKLPEQPGIHKRLPSHQLQPTMTGVRPGDGVPPHWALVGSSSPNHHSMWCPRHHLTSSAWHSAWHFATDCGDVAEHAAACYGPGNGTRTRSTTARVGAIPNRRTGHLAQSLEVEACSSFMPVIRIFLAQPPSGLSFCGNKYSPTLPSCS